MEMGGIMSLVCLPFFPAFRRRAFYRWSGLAAAVIVAAGAPAFADDETGGDTQARSGGKTSAASTSTNITVEGIVIARDKPRSTPLTGPFNSQDFTAVTSSDINGMGDVSEGLRATIRAQAFGQPVEFSAFYVLPFIAEELKTGLSAGSAPVTNAIYANDPGGDIANYTNSQNIASLYAKHSTKLFGAEANAVDVLNVPGLLLGARTIYYGEELETVTTKATSATAQDAVSIQTDNYLVGLQVGMEHMWDVGEGLKLGGSVKGGLYANEAQRTRSFLSRNQTQTRAQQNTLDDSAFAQAVEINPRIEFELAKGVSLSAGATFLWLNNVSGAFSQYATVTDLDDRNIRAKDNAFFYGATAGLTINLDELASGPSRGGATGVSKPAADASPADIEARIAELEATTARTGTPMSVSVYGQINRMILGWSDGEKHDAVIVDNVSSPSLFGIEGAAKITRGWTAGYHVEVGVEDTRSNAISQLTDDGAEGEISMRFADLWLRNNRYGTVTMGLTSPATDNIILADLGGTGVAASPNISLIGSDIILRAANSPDLGSGSLITRTTLGDFVGGATLDTARRDVVRYETPTIDGFEFSVSAGENDFWDAALNYHADWDEWRFRGGIGYMRDIDDGTRSGIGTRDRREWKGSASLMHVPTGVFITTAFVNREFHGSDPSDQATFGERTVGLVTPPGTNRPDLQYGYLKAGIRRDFTSFGDTKIYAEAALAKDGITGLREAGPQEVTDSALKMLGFGIVQEIDSAGMEIYLAARHFEFDIEGARSSTTFGTITSPAPIEDIDMVYAGTRIKF